MIIISFTQGPFHLQKEKKNSVAQNSILDQNQKRIKVKNECVLKFVIHS